MDGGTKNAVLIAGPAGEGVEAHLHVGLALDALEVDGQEVLDLEPLRGLLHALALQEVLGLDALLGRGRR